jgi:hypothetical protein
MTEIPPAIYPRVSSLEVARYVATRPHLKANYTTAIQILDSNVSDLDFPNISDNCLRLKIDDIISVNTKSVENGYYKGRTKESLIVATEENLINPVVEFAKNQFDAIVPNDFVDKCNSATSSENKAIMLIGISEKISELIQRTYVHCYAGKSRSTATSLIYTAEIRRNLCKLLWKCHIGFDDVRGYSNNGTVNGLFTNYIGAVPNTLFIQLYDAFLWRNELSSIENFFESAIFFKLNQIWNTTNIVRYSLIRKSLNFDTSCLNLESLMSPKENMSPTTPQMNFQFTYTEK